MIQERRSHEAAKLRDEAEKKLHKLESYADKLDRIAGSDFQPSEDGSWTMELVHACHSTRSYYHRLGSFPDHIDDLAEELEDSEDPVSFMKCVDRKDAGCLSLFLRKKCAANREEGGEEIDRELTVIPFTRKPAPVPLKFTSVLRRASRPGKCAILESCA